MLFPASTFLNPRPQLTAIPQPHFSGGSAPLTSATKSSQCQAISGNLNSNQTVLLPLFVTLSDTNTGSPDKYVALSVVNRASTFPANKTPGIANAARDNVINGFNITQHIITPGANPVLHHSLIGRFFPTIIGGHLRPARPRGPARAFCGLVVAFFGRCPTNSLSGSRNRNRRHHLRVQAVDLEKPPPLAYSTHPFHQRDKIPFSLSPGRRLSEFLQQSF